MRVVSVNVSAGVVVEWRGTPVETGIFKAPVAARVRVRTFGVDGDRQVDRTVHGGEHKAVYAYSADHYSWWCRELGRELGPGTFGENLTIEGLQDDETCVGDILRVGDVLLEAAQPRLPCYKLGIRLGDPRMVKRFLESGRLGIYFRVLAEGELGEGDAVTRVHEDARRLPVPELARWLDPRTRDPAMAAKALSIPTLAPAWAERLRAEGLTAAP
jgi:MOSC domain-containing protein YiiM